MLSRKLKCELQHKAESFFAAEPRNSLEFIKKKCDVLQKKNDILHTVDDDPHFSDETKIVSMMQRMIQSHNTSYQIAVCEYAFSCTAYRLYDDDGIDLIQCVVELTTEALLGGRLIERKAEYKAMTAVLSIFGSSSQFTIEEKRTLFSRDCVIILCVFYDSPMVAMVTLDCIHRVLGELADEVDVFRPAICDALQQMWNSHTNKAVAARARTLLFDHQLLVTCGLCCRHVPKGGGAEGQVCAECKCFVCSDCDCGGYHLERMELGWAASSKKKPKRKRKRKTSRGSKTRGASASPVNTDNEGSQCDNEKCSSGVLGVEDDVCDLDLVLYLEQTGSILAVDALMNILESKEEDRGEEDWQVIDSLRQATTAYRKVLVSCSN